MKRVLKHLLWIVPAILVIAVASLATYAATKRSADARYHAKLQKTIQVSSNSFKADQEMPVDFSCSGKSTAPDITWTYPAQGTKSYALIAMDWEPAIVSGHPLDTVQHSATNNSNPGRIHERGPSNPKNRSGFEHRRTTWLHGAVPAAGHAQIRVPDLRARCRSDPACIQRQGGRPQSNGRTYSGLR